MQTIDRPAVELRVLQASRCTLGLSFVSEVVSLMMLIVLSRLRGHANISYSSVSLSSFLQVWVVIHLDLSRFPLSEALRTCYVDSMQHKS